MDKASFFEGYYKGKFVHVPTKDSPKSSVEKVRQHIESNGDEKIKTVLDPHSISRTELKKFCEENNLPIGWIIDDQDSVSPG